MFFPVPPKREHEDSDDAEPQPPLTPIKEEEPPTPADDGRPLIVWKVILSGVVGVVVVFGVLRLPAVFEASKNSDYDRSRLYATFGFTLLLMALSLWLIRTGLWPNAVRKQKPKPTESRLRWASGTIKVVFAILVGILIGYLRNR